MEKIRELLRNWMEEPEAKQDAERRKQAQKGQG